MRCRAFENQTFPERRLRAMLSGDVFALWEIIRFPEGKYILNL